MIGSIIGPIIGLTTPGGGGGPPPAVETRFVSTWDTTQAGSASDTIILPMTAGNLVDWGDGNEDNLNAHTYSVGGIKTVKIDGAVTGFRFNELGDKDKILTVENWGGFDVSANKIFLGCQNLVHVSTVDAPTVSTSTMQSMFLLTAIPLLDLTKWPLGSVANLSQLLWASTAAVELRLGSSTGSVATMFGLVFANSTLVNFDGRDWDVGAVTTFASAFDGTLDTTDYNDMWINFSTQALKSNVPFDGGNSVATGAGLTARNFVISTYSWTVTDAS